MHRPNSAPTALLIEEHGFLTTPGACAATLPLSAATDMLATWRRKPKTRPAFLRLPHLDEEREKARLWSRRFREQSRRLIVLGIGGSSLGGNMLVAALAPNGWAVTFYDNICPEFLASLYDTDWEDVTVLAVSKSGETAETLAQFLTVLPVMRARLGPRYRAHAAVITENPNGDLAVIARDAEIPIIEHPAVGGRFSALSVVGLLPAVFAGADIDSLLAGASTMAEECLRPHPQENPALRYALAQAGMFRAGRNLTVIMAYGQRLEKITSWFRQLWAESLGKRDQAGGPQGLTPVDGRGVTDQHSQLQLYLDGPPDKQFTLLHDPGLATMGATIPGDSFHHLPAVAPLAGRTIGELFAAEFLGTRDALIHRGAPVRVLSLAAADPYALGEMILLLEMETVLVAELLGVTPFDQPAVEDGKRRARTYLQSMT
ncbi:MAG: glucose-6-phosphate isomerase [Magnetococcales bacterium]|nr:glucose-6-phosphate isomerase [Magnetococcales bacterium]